MAQQDQHQTGQLPLPVRLATLVAMVGILAAAIVNWSEIEAWLAAAGNGGLAVFSGVFIILTSCCFPVSMLGFTAGYIYDPLPAFGVLVSSVLVSGSFMFMLGRSSLRSVVARLLARDPRLSAMQHMAAKQALRLNLLARLSPFNYGLVCYTLAAGPTRWREYLLGLVAAVPSLAIQVAVGRVARQGLDAKTLGPWQLVGTIVGIGSLLALGWQVSRMARQAWQKTADEGQGGDGHDAEHG
ncbi:hypothetical protein DRQ50_08860 [bacterium]|nr:MAG: hypothetical protein DRQ50_08860 [bacterium]